MIVDKIDNTDSYSVRFGQYDITWYLVRDASTEHPRAISIGRDGRQRHLDPKGATSKRAIKAVRQANSTAVRDAVDAWHEVSDKYADFGASDTEPRGVFADVFEAAVQGLDFPLPRGVRGWQIFDRESMDGKPGSGEAARALTAAAKAVVQAVKRNPAEGAETFKYFYGYVPFDARLS